METLEPTLTTQIESLLFVSNKPLTIKQLAKITQASEEAVQAAAAELAQLRAGTGIVLLDAPDGLQLATNSQNSDLVKAFLNADLRENLTDATIEVLAIISYRQPISKAEIEAIRGVNSQYSLRALLMRGLIEKIPNPNDARGSVYVVTTEFLQQMGITSVDALPDFDDLVSKIKLPETPAVTNSEDAVEEVDLEINDGLDENPIMDEEVVSKETNAEEINEEILDEAIDELNQEQESETELENANEEVKPEEPEDSGTTIIITNETR